LPIVWQVDVRQSPSLVANSRRVSPFHICFPICHP
jgi:hypothetical protein